MKITTAAERVIPLAEAIHKYWETELPKRHPRYPIVDPDADDGPPPPEVKQLRHFLTRLSEDTVYKLALLMHLGQGYLNTSDLPDEYQAIRIDFNSPSKVISYMMATVPLAEYLREGLSTLKLQALDLDKMDFTTAKASK